jgi:hypothetical protein
VLHSQLQERYVFVYQYFMVDAQNKSGVRAAASGTMATTMLIAHRTAHRCPMHRFRSVYPPLVIYLVLQFYLLYQLCI